MFNFQDYPKPRFLLNLALFFFGFQLINTIRKSNSFILRIENAINA